jgi:phosphate transport system protein
MEHQSSSFEKELAELKDNILKMGVEVQALIHQSVEALKKQDVDLAKKVIEKDNEVDQLELKIDSECTNLIALRNPKASDLRFILTGLRLTIDLERIGDLACDIAGRVIRIGPETPIKPLVDIPKMAQLDEETLKLVLDAFVKKDTSHMSAIWKNENEVDKLRNQVHEELLGIIEKNPAAVRQAVLLLLVSRHLERISDHLTNIAEAIVYMVDAKVIKHGGPEI